MKKLASLACIIALALQACGGGGGSSSPSAPAVTPPPSFVSPHPETWETQSATDAGFNATALSDAFNYAMQDGSFTQAAMVIRDGKLIQEEYRGIADGEINTLVSLASDPGAQDPAFWTENYGTRDSASLMTSWSTAKSFTSLLIGMAIEKEFITSTNQLASDFITEWQADDRINITIEQLLDMRSGLVPVCFLANSGALGECTNQGDAAAGGNIVFYPDQMTGCINRGLAVDGAPYPWDSDGIYTEGEFLYSNCDTQVLGEILFRATGQDPGTFAQAELFEPINMTAYWWRDNVESGQANGNYLSYCCLDATAQDFAKFGYLMQLGGIEVESGTQYSEYVSDILAMDSFYDKQFWSFCAEQDGGGNCLNRVIHTSGFDGQFVVMDFKHNLIIVRASLYKSYLNHSDDRKMLLIPGSVATSNWLGSVPSAMAIQAPTTFSIAEFHARVVSAISQ
jgi:CubicO group peptidase (beta-lactamase class C family)